MRYACTAAAVGNASYRGYVGRASDSSQDAVEERLLASSDEAFKGVNGAVLAMIACAHLVEERRVSDVSECRNGRLDLVALAGVARRPALLVAVEVGEEGESLPDGALPAG